MDIIIPILKYTGSLIAGAYGVYATLTDFKDEKNGKKVLSRKGYFGIGLLISSLLLNLSTDAFKDYRERQQARVNEDRQKQLVAQQKDTSIKLGKELDQTTAISSELTEALNQLNHTSTKMDTNLKTTTSVLSETERSLSRCRSPSL